MCSDASHALLSWVKLRLYDFGVLNNADRPFTPVMGILLHLVSHALSRSSKWNQWCYSTNRMWNIAWQHPLRRTLPSLGMSFGNYFEASCRCLQYAIRYFTFTVIQSIKRVVCWSAAPSHAGQAGSAHPCVQIQYTFGIREKHSFGDEFLATYKLLPGW